MTVDGPAPMRSVASFQTTTSMPTSTPATVAGARSGPRRNTPARAASTTSTGVAYAKRSADPTAGGAPDSLYSAAENENAKMPASAVGQASLDRSTRWSVTSVGHVREDTLRAADRRLALLRQAARGHLGHRRDGGERREALLQ